MRNAIINEKILRRVEVIDETFPLEKSLKRRFHILAFDPATNGYYNPDLALANEIALAGLVGDQSELRLENCLPLNLKNSRILTSNFIGCFIGSDRSKSNI